jgi:general secretion pathway protein D
MMHSDRRLRTIAALLAAVSLTVGCAAGRSFSKGERAARAGDWDTAAEHYRRAVQESPDRPDYKISLERAMITASQQHLDQARIFEARFQLDEALREYRRASELDPPNRQVAGKAAEIEQRIRDQAEATRPRTSVQQLREQARESGPPPLFNLTTVLPGIRFNNTGIRDILNSIGMTSGINVTYDSTFQDRPYTVQLDNVTLEEALNQILTANQLFFKVTNPKSVIVVPDNAQKRAQYEEQVIRTFFISHADATELAQLVNTVIRVPGGQTQPTVAANKTANTITVRATTNVAAIVERLVEANDNPRAEIVADVQILEVSRARIKQFGLDLGDYAISATFSPEVDPRGTGTGASATTPSRSFNANTVSRGVNTSDFYLAVPSAVVRFLESDVETKTIAKSQLRGAEGQKLTLNLGEEIPVPSTAFTPIAQGGASFNPLTSFNYRQVGVILEMTPRVTFEGDVVLDLYLESSSLGKGLNVAGQNLPSFNSRKVTTKLRLRDGESNLLAGLLQEEERKSLKGFPGILRLPIVRQLFSSNDTTVGQTDIIMLLTPRIVRTHELTPRDVSAINIGTQQNLSLGGPPPLIVQAPTQATPVAAIPASAQPAAGVATSAPQPPRAAAPLTSQGNQGPGQNSAPTTMTPAATSAPGATAVSPSAPALAPAGGQVMISMPEGDFRVGGGPYTVPISVTGASWLSSMSLTVSYNPSVLRVRSVQEGSFMRSGGVQALFTNRSDSPGRIDLAIVRPGDTTGVAGTGLLAALLFDTIGQGAAGLTVTGTGSAPGGGPLSLQFSPIASVSVR